MLTATASYHYLAIPTDLALRIRTTLRDDYGNALSVWRSDADGNPCRHCLRLTHPGERLILFAYRPFEEAGPYAEIGPIFIHADACERYDAQSVFPPNFVSRALTLRAYGRTERGSLSIVDAQVSTPEPDAARRALERLFSNVDTSFVHVRSPAWGCYDFRIERNTPA